MRARVQILAYVFGVFNYGFDGRGRLSVYTKSENRWVKRSGSDSADPLLLYQCPSSGDALPLITLERFTGGDHEDAYLKSWTLRQGKLVRQSVNVAGCRIQVRSYLFSCTVVAFGASALPGRQAKEVEGFRLQVAPA